jgi:hypothetical protein
MHEIQGQITWHMSCDCILEDRLVEKPRYSWTSTEMDGMYDETSD